jgi:FMN phosphatase YigB (HAD superfamily)
MPLHALRFSTALLLERLYMKPEETMIDLRGMKAAFFDCFNTLLFPEDWPFLVAMGDFLGKDPKAVNYQLKNLKSYTELGDVTAAERIVWAAALLGKRISTREARDLAVMELEVMVEHSVVYPGVHDALGLLGNHLRTALMSNAHPNNRRVVYEKGLAETVKRGYFSCDPDVKVRKPDQQMYRIGLDGLAVDPHDCVYFGDGGDHELEQPRKLGMTVVWVRSPHQCAVGTPDYDYVVNGVQDLLELCVF